MPIDALSPRQAAAVGALALIPVALYGYTLSATAAAFSTVNVLLTLAVLYIAMSPVEGGHHGDSGAAV
ncbi:ba3-type terminal oxidase subunit CbaE [Natronomonas pharaonis DSM 2160]|uniref:Ba3-type terminal oxidase subunit CbaE n=1 Tax=Natronomonas pharaonis (strain ATCC 35678 / DSM 2160 / CIP 103997 / JCM 8858 / NBRC 14720 / NCIMB 2260 / Gabara) TaxID=348780 RepID=A0A1U7EWV8_NATPD|nr:hypothetical protein [Natronomonas pharaonis]CAI49575.1 ba3-type terminal oxidase subunit CbaE [Natronomonas pharaonis DSM 2160]